MATETKATRCLFWWFLGIESPLLYCMKWNE
jgi:hypothetical protein